MENKGSERYWVLLARPVIQTTVVEVKASNYDEALGKAKKKASKLPDSNWEGSYQPHEYGIDALMGLADSYFEPDEDPEEYMRERTEDFRYMLLRADLDGGTGELIVEPWLRECSSLLVADLLQDWNASTEQLYTQAAENWIESLERHSKDIAPKTSAKITYLAAHIEKKRLNKSERNE